MAQTPLKLLGLAALLTACSTGPYIPSGNPNSPEAVGEPIVILDKEANTHVAVDTVRWSSAGSQKFLVLEASLRNRTGRDLPIQVQTLFRDANGQTLYTQAGNETGWTSIVLTANGTTPYRSQALTSAATTGTVRVRLQKRPERD
jgi:hypothetical protein